MIIFLLSVGIPFLLCAGIIYLLVKRDKRIAAIEMSALPITVYAYPAASSAVAQVLACAAVTVLGLLMTLPADMLLFRNAVFDPGKDAAVWTIWIIGLLLFCFASWGLVLGLIHLLRDTAMNSSSNPLLQMNGDGLVFKERCIGWSAIADFNTYSVSDARIGSYSYLVLCFAEPVDTIDSKGSIAHWFMKLHRREIRRTLGLPEGRFLLIPLYIFNRPQEDLRVLALRYWCRATNREYKPQQG